ncbi:MAG: hypothetical protein V3T18_05240 [Pseudomonadales bacterium]
MPRLIYVGKFIVALAATWAVGASIYIFFSPLSGRGITARRTFGESGSVVETYVTEQSWYEAQGLWGVFVLVVFAGIYLFAVRLAWNGRYIALTIVIVITIALSIIAGFSIGGIYFPAAVGLVVGALILLSARLLTSR